MIFRWRRRFEEAIARQIDLFESEHAGLLRDLRDAERTYDRAERGEAEERYGDYLDLVATAAELLAEVRDGFASTLDGEAAGEYEHAFNRAVVKRFPRLAVEIEDA